MPVTPSFFLSCVLMQKKCVPSICNVDIQRVWACVGGVHRKLHLRRDVDQDLHHTPRARARAQSSRGHVLDLLRATQAGGRRGTPF